MLIQITNKCLMGCAHCMQDSNAEGEHMSLNTFNKILQFLIYCKVKTVIVSGGEPTEHPEFDKICSALHNHGIIFSICSNGTWCLDDSKCSKVYGVLALSNCTGMQVYTNIKWYKDYDLILSRKDTTFNHPKIVVETMDIRSMQDLGRAKVSEAARKEVLASPYYMSCLNGALAAKQTSNIKDFFNVFLLNNIFCKPLFDCKGNLHLSESWLCPSCGNIAEDTYLEIWNKIKQFKPCGNCLGCQKFKQSQSLNILKAKSILGI